MPFGLYKLGRVANGKITKFLTNDVVNDQQIMDHKWAKGLGLVSFAGYKLQDTNGGPMGVLALFSKQSITTEEDAMLEGLAGITTHVIQTVKAEEALRVERDKLINILESMEDGVYIVNQAYDIEYINPVIEREFGPVEGRKCYEYFHDRDEVCPWCKNQKVFAGKTVRWEWYSAKNNKTYDLLDTPLRNYDGSISKLEIFRDITERKHSEDMIQQLAYYDVLTGLPNRTLLHDRLQQAIFEAKSGNRPLVLLVMDLDRFKEINNTLGHHSGDIILKQTGDRLRIALPETATLARTGGDEFAVVLPDTDAEGANRIADSFIKSLKEPFTLEGIAINVNASIGMVTYPGYGDDANTLMQYADMAMYRAKNTKSGLTIYSPQHNQYSPERLALISELRHSIDSDQMFLLYQPKIDLKTGSPVGVESLVRWQHPRLGVIPPNQFIALAEHTGLIKDLTLWVIKESLKQSRIWKQEGLQVCVAVNLSMQNLQVPELLKQIKLLISRSSMAPANLRLELTESTIMRDPERSMEILTQMAAMGIHFSIDDFGTGYSSLGYLQKLPVDEIKIDKSFVINMMADENSIAIVHSIIELAHSLRIKVVAEGVENKETMKRLTLLGCDMAQGYFISRPIPGSEVKGWLELGAKGD
ncbi:MAG: EAL domain-containing protein [Nitrospirae bacterium]|nr:EAL domain-containing protein [Nitrospirota bacterium]